MAAAFTARAFCPQLAGAVRTNLNMGARRAFATSQAPLRQAFKQQHQKFTQSSFSSPSSSTFARCRSAFGSSGGFNAFRSSGRRTFTSDSSVITRPTQQQGWYRMALSGLMLGGGIVAINAFFNRETRGELSLYESDYLRSTFGYVGAGLGIVAATAVAMHRNGFALKVMRANPWLVIGGSLAVNIVSMLGVFNTDPSHHGQKLLFWGAFQVAQAAVLSPLFFLSPALLSRAALYTAGIVGSISYVGATAKSDKYLYLGGPLLCGVTLVALSSLAPMVLPIGTRALIATEAISLYGGLAVFGGFVLYDTQKMLKHAQMAQQGIIRRDPVKESIAFELDFINIFIRLVTILQGQQRKR